MSCNDFAIPKSDIVSNHLLTEGFVKASAVSVSRQDILATLAAFVDYALFTLIILLTGGIWLRLGGLALLGFLKGVALILALVAFALRLPTGKLTNIGYIPLWCLLSVGAILVQLYFLKSDFVDTISIFGSLIVFALYSCVLSTENDFRLVFRRFIRIAWILAALSLIFFFLGSCLHVLTPTGIVTYEWDWIRRVPSYWNLYFEPQNITFLGMYEGVRNCGVFAESPMFIFVLCVALMLQELFFDSDLVVRSVLLTAIITSFSTTAYVVLILLYGLKWLLLGKKSGFLANVKPLAGPITVFILVSALVILMIDKSTASNSYTIRVDHLAACMSVFWDYFPFGCGAGNKALITVFMAHEQGLSVGIPYLLAQTGIFGLLVIAVPIIYGMHKAQGKDRLRLLIVTSSFLWLFFTTNVVYTSVVQWLLLPLLFFAYPSARLFDPCS